MSGSGVIWSQAWTEMQTFVEKAGIPFYTTPQGRGVVPDDHPLSFLTMRSTAFKDADLIVILGTRMNYIIGHGVGAALRRATRRSRASTSTRDELATAPRKIDIPILGDCKAVLQQLIDALPKRIEPENFAQWRKKLAEGEAAKKKETGGGMSMNKTPIHPLRLCEEVKNFMKRDAILVVDGQEILNFGRQSMPTFAPGHRLNSGPFGMMGVGMPFGVGAKVACPDKQVIVRARRRLVRPERDGARHGGASQAAGARRDQPERRLDGRSEEGKDRPQSRLHALRQDGRGARLLRRICREAGGHRPGARACAEESRRRHGRARQREDRRYGARRHGVVLVARGRGDRDSLA